MPDLTITLIHGTFARGAPWTQEGSPLWKDLQNRFKCSALIDRFDWSGDNTMIARVEAASELARHLDELKARFPSAKQYLVAHSHGGNVALYATEQTQVYGVACMATPFLHASPRDPALLGVSPIQRGLFGIACLLMYISSFVWTFRFIPWIISLLLIVLFSNIAAALASGVLGHASQTSVAFADMVTARVPQNTSFCVFRVAGDEASLSLGSGQLMAWVAIRLYDKLSRTKQLNFLVNPLRKIKIPKMYWYLPVVSVVLAFSSSLFTKNNPTLASVLFVYCYIGLSLSVILFLSIKTTFLDNVLFGMAYVLMGVAAPIGIILFGLLPPKIIFGERPRFWSIFRWIIGIGYFVTLAIYTEVTPTGGPWTVYQFDQDPDRGLDCKTQLAHSVYNHPKVRAKLVEWLAECASV